VNKKKKIKKRGGRRNLRPASHLDGKAKKRKPIRTCGKTKAYKRNVPLTTIASSDWLPLFRQGVNPALKSMDL